MDMVSFKKLGVDPEILAKIKELEENIKVTEKLKVREL